MAEIDDLRRQIQELEKRLARQMRENEENTRKIAEKGAANLRKAQENFERNVREIDAQYERRLSRFQETQMAELQRVTEDLRRQDAAAQRERQEILNQLARKNDELRRELQQIQEEQIRWENAGRSMAETRIESAQEQERRVSEMPHEFFFHGQLAIYREHLFYAQSMLRGERYDAAVASADSALAELETLDIRIRESQREWEEEFRIYRLYATELKARIDRFETEPVLTPCGEFHLRDDDRAYWSREEYDGIRQEALDAYRVVEEIDRAGVTPYLNAGHGLKKSRLIQANRNLQRLSERLTAVTRCISAERLYSDQRFLMGEAACDVLENMGAKVSRMDFRDGQPIDSYDVVAAIGQNDVVTVTFLPQREDGVVIQNRCLIALDVRTVPNQELIDEAARDIMERLRSAIPELKAEWRMAVDERSAGTEQRYKREPDTQLLARKLELKYH